MVNARLEALEDRLLPEKRLRPPLSADKKRSQASPAAKPIPAQAQAIAKPGVAATAHPAPAEAKKKSKKKKKKKKQKKKGKAGAVHQAAAPRAPRPLPSAPSTMEEPWNVVAKKGTKKQATTTQKKSGPVKLHPPRTAAVVLTLQPGAEENGASYAGVLAQARARIKLDELGIGAVRFRRAVTGARILEVTGSTSNVKADSLAQKLREALDENVVRVNRPIRSAEMRISGLDDSVTTEDLVAAVARAGQCAADQVKPGEIRRDKTGLDSVWLRCPVDAAKKVSEGGRLLVGWVAAQVKLLETRPMRCYRCLETGHVRVTCDAEVDRSNLCYRCGQAGHISQKCTAAPHCNICEAAGKSANHRMGSCIAPSKRRNRGRKVGDGSRASSLPARPSASAETRAEVEPTMAVD
ncbi:zinc finger CCHC domain-containing protein 3-like [Pectinophora gossypiella]|uniref:zinc finger CCHC domain-containing protein 3-like n=1 Tax=Pectinophora gossypiella TaxID=13191 RepID=UPI00214E7617|nr:zinc finger CCHC domain-containing protein 3-like [Pectinophora gossypiella]